MSDRCVICAQAFGSLGFEANRIRRDIQQFSYAGANCACVWDDPGLGQHEGGIKVRDRVASVGDSSQSLPQENRRVGALPFRVRGWEKRANIRRGDGAEQGIGNGVEENVSVGVAAESSGMRQGNAANSQRNTGDELV